MEDVYAAMPRQDLLSALSEAEQAIHNIHDLRARLNVEEAIAQEHRDTIVRALGVVVLSDHRYQG